MECSLHASQVQDAFLAAPPALASQILDLSVKVPNWMRDVFEVSPFPLGNGTTLEQIIYRGQMPQIERGFDRWKKLANNTGCAPCEGPDCSYNWTNFGGSGLERKLTEMMAREFRSPEYCINQIKTTAHFKEVFAQIVLNLYRQVDFFKEMNVGLNVLTSLAKKFVVDSGGAKPNTANPYVYPNIGTARLSALNIEILEFFYEWMRRIPDAVPYDNINGAPVYALEASHQLLARLYRDDPNLRQDVRFSGLANDLVSKYNFMSTIRGMFIAAPILYPRRFNIVAGEPVEVLPFVNDIPMEIGSFTGFNPAYEAATHEEVTVHGKYPFKLFYMPTEDTLGQNTSFGPEFSWFNSWMWVNPQTVKDPFRRVGYFATSANIGISQQFSEGIFSILVERPTTLLMASFYPNATCPPAASPCSNEIPATGCPCPLITGYSANPITAGQYFITLAVPTDAEAEDTIQFGLDTGGYITGTVVAVSSDAKTVSVTFSGGVTLDTCDHFTTLFCDNTLGCSADVLNYEVVCTDATRLRLVLSNNIKADTASDVVTLYYGDGTSASATIVSVDMLTNTYVVDIGGTAFCDQVNGIVSICVPPGTDATCPTCGGLPTSTQCSEE